MHKAIYCALAMLIGAMIGGTAPEDWRGDAARYATIAMSDAANHLTAALVYRPHQGD
ncbi:MAG TPA: hypothetical protein VHM01_24280 [Alphaproteobacteria bacterium]|nr:hypothetical protein [Alphaproteobacteria bacterium]